MYANVSFAQPQFSSISKAEFAAPKAAMYSKLKAYSIAWFAIIFAFLLQDVSLIHCAFKITVKLKATTVKMFFILNFISISFIIGS